MKFAPSFIVALLCGVLLKGVSAQPVGLDFEEQELTGWFKPQAITDYAVTLSTHSPQSGSQCVEISSIADNPDAFGNVMQYIDARPFRGMKITFKAYVRSEAGVKGRGQMWFRVDRENEKMGFFDNMNDRPITSPEWREYSITGTIAEDARGIAIGCMLIGKGKIYFDNVSFTSADGTPLTAVQRRSYTTRKSGSFAAIAPEPARALTDRGLENLLAFSRLYGYLRYFHPSDQSAEADWISIAINGVRAVENARDGDDLAVKLQTFFKSVAPSVVVYTESNHPDAFVGTLLDGNLTYWEHQGVDVGNTPSIYSSMRTRITAESFINDARYSSIKESTTLTKDIGSGVKAYIPLVLNLDGRSTLPKQLPPYNDTLENGYTPSGNDRATRLADVIMAWNIFQHFYPYFDVVKTDWSGALRNALTRAALTKDEDEFFFVLSEMTGQLHDGHASISKGMGKDIRFAPFSTYVEGNTVIITGVHEALADQLKRGEFIEKINGEDVAIHLDRRRALISSPTVQYEESRLQRNLLGHYKKEEVTLTVRGTDGTKRDVRVETLTDYQDFDLKRPEHIAELEPGIYYVNLDKVKSAAFDEALDKLAGAEAIIFDMRGYPADDLRKSIEHIIDQPVRSARWNVPVTRFPDRQNVEWDFSDWSIKPAKPRFTKNIVHLTDGRAISAAETYMGIIENYKIGEIVGSPTAGTNGNVNPFVLPGGYRLSWTGMKVLKHNGSQHHGIGILPTVPCKPTVEGIRAGRDEVLEKGIEVAKKMIGRQ